VSLIDGQYEAIKQRPTNDGRTLVDAVDHEGKPVRIVWYDFPESQRKAFERYRRALRALQKQPSVRLLDVVSRPGANYTVWEAPADLKPTSAPPELLETLTTLSLPTGMLDVRKTADGPALFGIDWPDAIQGERHAAKETATPARHSAGRTPGRAAQALATAALSVVLFAASAAIALLAWNRWDPNASTSVPDITGLPVDAAAERLHEAGLNADLRAVAGDGPAGTVQVVEPRSGSIVRPGRTVSVDYLRGDGVQIRVDVPDLRGLGREEAQQEAVKASFILGQVASVPSSLPFGTVIAQNPLPSGRAAPNTAVDVLVSQGPARDATFLPDLVGLPYEDARTLARTAGISPDRILADAIAYPSAPVGHVVAMTPSAWHEVDPAAVTVRLLVNDPTGARLRDDAGDEAGIPDVTGRSAPEARAILEALGMDVRLEPVRASGLPDGVILQDPPPGATLGPVATLSVNAAPRVLTVPTPTARLMEPQPVAYPYRFLVEPGIPAVDATVVAFTGDGEIEVDAARVQGGGEIAGVFETRIPDVTGFELRLNGIAYARLDVP
jgi:beta-lactam-binding protein with PASTA domain